MLQERLVTHLRNRVRAGELTERGLARLIGMSQPHLHNVLKGVRSLSLEYSDQILDQLNLSATDLLSASEIGNGPIPQEESMARVPWLSGAAGPLFVLGEKSPERDSFEVPRFWTGSLRDPVMVKLASDPMIYPHFQEGDIALVDRAIPIRENLKASAIYLVQLDESTIVRSVRVGGTRLYLVTPGTLEEPRHWEYLPLLGQDLAGIIRGRIVWLGRQMPTS